MSSKTPPTPSSPHTPTTPTSHFSGETLVDHPLAAAAAATISATKSPSAASVQYRRKLAHLCTPLAPLLSITSGTAHPAFPRTMLHYNLLTEDQLNELAHHYHQRTPSQWSLCYPLPVVGRWHADNDAAAAAVATAAPPAWQGQVQGQRQQANHRLEAKRRRFGRFVGLRGCESPVNGDDAGREREERAMEMWVEGEIRKREERAWAEMTGRGKGCW